MKSECLIRRRNREDCSAITHIVTISWNETYQGIVPDWYLQELKHNEEERTEKALAEFSEEKNPFLVLEMNEELAGFVWYGPAYDKVFDDCGEIIALYLIKKYQGRGLGRQLMEAAVHELKMLGYEKMVIACLKGNPANEFYQHMGGVYIKDGIYQRLNLQEHIYYFEKI